MTDLNRVFLLGNLTKDAEIKTLPNGTEVVTFSIANNYSYKDSNTGNYCDKANFFYITLFNGSGLYPYLVKGQKVLIEGKLRQDVWQDNAGSTKSKTTIIADSVQLVGGKKDANVDMDANVNANTYTTDNNNAKKQFGYDGFTPKWRTNKQTEQQELELNDDIPF